MIYYTKSENETFNLGLKIGKMITPGTIITLSGDLAAGKTVFAKGIGKALNVIEDITSPTYNIVCEYNGNIPFYHLDLYRISDYEEFLQLGVEHLLYDKGVSVIEWSERISDELPDEIIKITIEIDKISNQRKINIEGLNIE